MSAALATQADLDEALRRLVARDQRLQPIFAVAGAPALRRRDTGFAGLAAIICAQQLSTASASAIWGRLRAAFDPFDARTICKVRPARLARMGLSAAKIRTLKSVARELAASRLDLDLLARDSAEAAHGKLTALHGIGPWTAEIYLLFCLGHADAWPAGDVALQEAIRLGFRLESRPTAAHAIEIAERWRPWRGAAAHLWWAYYKSEKHREGAIAEATIKMPIQGAPQARRR